jgi:enediyne biosynthesis protein E3
MAGILQKLLSISPAEASFARRSFHFLHDSARQRLEQVGETFLQGYHLALADQGIELLVEHLNEIDLEFRGYAFEGAAMGLDILDQLQPWKAQRIHELLRGPGQVHVYMVHVGIGWSMARLRWGIKWRLAKLDPLLQWLALDGFGFHEGYFHWSHYAGGATPRFTVLRGYGLRVFDQGLGRSLWFVSGADPEHITSAIMRLPEARRNDLWSGIGLACTYAGGADSGDVRMLRLASGQHWPHLAQGAVFAAGARQRAGNMAAQTQTGCELLCGLSAQRAAELCEETLRNVAADASPAYEMWRRLIREHLQLNEELSELLVNCSGSLLPSGKMAQPQRGATGMLAHPKEARQ